MILAGRTAVVTGAGSGIGRAIAISLAKRHCHLALSDIDASGLEQTGELVRDRGINVSLHAMDVADRTAVAALPFAVNVLVHAPVWGPYGMLVKAPILLLLVALYLWRRSLPACVLAHVLIDIRAFVF